MARPSEKILIVDDERRLLSALRRNLGSRYHILTAESGAEALETLAANPEIAVILTDMQMPGMNGVELLKKARENAPTVRRLMLTGNADQETAVSAVNDGAVLRFLRKPCEPDLIGEAFDFALDDYRFSTETETETQTDNGSSGQVARDSFLSIMSHELRTPLNHIIGLSQLIQLPDTKESEPSRKFLKTLRGSADDLLVTVVRMLDFARLSAADQPEVTDDVFDSMEVLKTLIDNERPSALERGITIALDCVQRHVDVAGVEENFSIALREILNNAVRFSKPEGHIGITVRRSASAIDFKITDSGVGIEEENLAKIYGTFAQADDSTTRAHGGIGLGLNLASAAIEQLGGSLSITSKVNRGTTAVISLPRPAATGDSDPASDTAEGAEEASLPEDQVRMSGAA